MHKICRSIYDSKRLLGIIKMCHKRNSTEIPYGNQANRFAKVDDCIAKEIIKLNKSSNTTISSCCGHGIYKKTIVILTKDGKTRIEKFSKKIIPRKRRFYIKDKRGYYYIPEVQLK